MITDIVPSPGDGTGTDTPNPNKIEHALSVLGAEQIAPGVWIATLSIGATIRISDPGTAVPAALAERVCPPPPEGLARRLADREAARVELHTRAAVRLQAQAQGASDAR